METNIKKIYELLTLFRTSIEKISNELIYPPFSKFPKGCCGYTCYLLAKYLKTQNIETIYVWGQKGVQSHAWLVIKDDRIKPATTMPPQWQIPEEFLALMALDGENKSPYQVSPHYISDDLKDGLIVDITSDQFGEVPVFVGYSNSFYEQFVFVSAHDMDNVYIGNEYEFLKDYDKIVTCINQCLNS